MSGVFSFKFSTGSCLYIYTIAPTNIDIIVILAPGKISYCGWNPPFYLLLDRIEKPHMCIDPQVEFTT